MCKTKTLIVLFIVLLGACNNKTSVNPCDTQTIAANVTTVTVAEVLGDSSYTIKNTAIANEPLQFTFTHPNQVKVIKARWNIEDSGLIKDNQAFTIRFTDTGKVAVTLFVEYQPLTYCGTPKNFTDTVTTTLHILPEDHTSILQGRYSGTIDSSAPFTISINYYKWPGDAVGGYYLYNYVNGCTGDGINPHIPAHTGYEITAGYSNFTIQGYPCNAPDAFRGFGYLNAAGDSITIQHFGYSTVTANTAAARWHVFKGKRL